jgi:hypothetical protein
MLDLPFPALESLELENIPSPDLWPSTKCQCGQMEQHRSDESGEGELDALDDPYGTCAGICG